MPEVTHTHKKTGLISFTLAHPSPNMASYWLLLCRSYSTVRRPVSIVLPRVGKSIEAGPTEPDMCLPPQTDAGGFSVFTVTHRSAVPPSRHCSLEHSRGDVPSWFASPRRNNTYLTPGMPPQASYRQCPIFDFMWYTAAMWPVFTSQSDTARTLGMTAFKRRYHHQTLHTIHLLASIKHTIQKGK